MNFENQLQAFMVTWVTHNSRISERMVEYGVRRGNPIRLDIEAERIITKAITRIVLKEGFRVLAYNICCDHVHMVLVCMPEDLSRIVQQLKAMSSREYHVKMGMTVPRQGRNIRQQGSMLPCPSPSMLPCPSPSMLPCRGTSQNQLWAQKFHRRLIDNENYLHNAIHYVKNNRQKHQLPHDERLQAIIDSMTCSIRDAFES